MVCQLFLLRWHDIDDGVMFVVVDGRNDSTVSNEPTHTKISAAAEANFLIDTFILLPGIATAVVLLIYSRDRRKVFAIHQLLAGCSP